MDKAGLSTQIDNTCIKYLTTLPPVVAGLTVD
jgi:hypothetical protein